MSTAHVPATAAAALSPTVANAKFLELSPMTAALAYATVQVAKQTHEVHAGALRIRVVQVTDLPLQTGPDPTSFTSWLRYSGRRPSAGLTAKTPTSYAVTSASGKESPVPSTICVLLRVNNGAPLSTESVRGAEAVEWNEEFFIDHVTTSEELKLYCIDRAKNEPHSTLPLRDDVAACPGFIGKVCVPLSRLPEGEEIEQWYPLVPKESYLSLRAALRVSLCFLPQGNRTASRSRADSAQLRRLNIDSSNGTASPITRLHLEIPLSPMTQSPPVPISTGVVDYVIVVGPCRAEGDRAGHENALLFRYPLTDRPQFPLPTKIEWFCFPAGYEECRQRQRPPSRLFSFLLVGGTDGLSRCYAVCFVFYHRLAQATSEQDDPDATVWQASCICLLTRVPLMQEMTHCLLHVAHSWLSKEEGSNKGKTEWLLAKLCNGVLLPIRGVLGVRFRVGKNEMSLLLPATSSIYGSHLGRLSVGSQRSSQFGKFSPTKSPSTNFINIQQGFQPLVYSLAPIFEVFDVKTVIHLVALVLCEYRILIHSTQLSLLCPVAEGLCALMYPFRWQHPYVPILPRVLSEYLQAPLPYILGVHSSWLNTLLDSGRPEHLVLVDVDRGVLQLHEAGGPVLPLKFTKGLHRRVQRILYPQLFDSSVAEPNDQFDSEPAHLRRNLQWDEQKEKLVRVEFVCFLTAILMGYRDCLFFVNQKLPVFNKRRFFATAALDNEVTPLVTRLFCTQAFQAFLENHSSTELSVFHSVYLTFSRGKELEWPTSMPWLSIAHHGSVRASFLDTDEKCEVTSSRALTPVFVMPEFDEDLRSSGRLSEGCENEHAEDEESDEADEHLSASALGCEVELLLDNCAATTQTLSLDSTELDTATATVLSRTIEYTQVAESMGVDPRVFEENVDLFLHPHQANHQQLMQHTNGQVAAMAAAASGPMRNLSSEEERIEQILHKCLTSVFTSDDALTSEDIQMCEARFKYQYARELFVLILMQPGHQYVEATSSSSGGGGGGGSNWYNPKGSGSCIGDTGFSVLVRLSSSLMDQCATHEDFTNARGVLQVASQYYHFVEDKHSGIGFAKKEYLLSVLKSRAICRSLDMWQHAFSREIDAALSADPTACDEANPNSVTDELFFSLIGSLVYDMLAVEVPVAKVQAFVLVMCSTYQKGKELLDTLKQLVDNVNRALDLSKDSRLSPPKTSNGSTSSIASQASTASTSSSSAPLKARDSPPSRQYDLDTVIRRKMSSHDPLPPPLPLNSKSRGMESQDDGNLNTPRFRHRLGSTSLPSSVLCNQSVPILSMAIFQGRVACGLADSTVTVVDTYAGDKRVRLVGHQEAVVGVQLRNNTLISGSRDHTLRAWDLRATTKKRHLFSFFSGSGTMSETQHSGLLANDVSATDIDAPCVARKSVVLRGHTAPITCVEIGRQLSTERALVASGSVDTTIRLWDTNRESSLAILGNGNGTVSCVRFLALYDYLITGCREHTLKIWDLSVSKLRTNILAHRGAIRDIQITGDRLVTAGNDRIVKVWDAKFRSGQSYIHGLRDHGGPVQCVSLGGPADPNICTGSADGVVRVWDLRYVSKGPRLTLSGHHGQITCLQRDFTKVVSGSEDGTVRIWDMHSGVCMKDMKAHMSGVTCLALRDAYLYSASWDGSVRLWDLDAVNTSSSGGSSNGTSATNNANVTAGTNGGANGRTLRI
ncbi:TPA: hypothetical protein N0F65_004196 [Lagenidium giganteum]|uniref:Uncharacterized protein n=1 Tax=Lagenidium giganteum TaxID=4803 RepID=A0AAV2YLW2_9STRA|nr:TPA: hypothetical protein N0F65_004196 [Lagenidium giganteum]